VGIAGAGERAELIERDEVRDESWHAAIVSVAARGVTQAARRVVVPAHARDAVAADDERGPPVRLAVGADALDGPAAVAAPLQYAVRRSDGGWAIERGWPAPPLGAA